MKLTAQALEKINTPAIRHKLAVALGSPDRPLADQTIQNYIWKNSDNLTKAAALKVIRKATGLKDKEILIEEIESVYVR